MNARDITQSSIGFVLLAHIGILAAVLYSSAQQNITTTLPVIQGIIVAATPVVEQTPPPPPLSEQKPLPEKRKTPLPRAPVSERAPQVEQTTTPVIPSNTPKPSEEPTDAPITPPQANTSEFNNPAPVYPTQSRRLRETGIVILEVLVKADGSLGDLRLKTSSGYSRLDEAALKAVKNWHFVAAKRGNETIDFWYELPIEFSLNR